MSVFYILYVEGGPTVFVFMPGTAVLQLLLSYSIYDKILYVKECMSHSVTNYNYVGDTK